MANRPAGLTTLVDQDFEFAWSGGGSLPGGGNVDAWQSGVCGTEVVDGRSVWYSTYKPGLSGGGPDTMRFGLPSGQDRTYVSFRVKWEDGFDHNPTSEKMLFFHHGSGYSLFQFLYGVESVLVGGQELYANRAPVPAGPPQLGSLPQALPVDGEWIEYEVEITRTGIKWWRNGVLHGEHSVSLPQVSSVDLDATWGGGGNKQGTHKRWTDFIVIAGD